MDNNYSDNKEIRNKNANSSNKNNIYIENNINV